MHELQAFLDSFQSAAYFVEGEEITCCNPEAKEILGLDENMSLLLSKAQPFASLDNGQLKKCLNETERNGLSQLDVLDKKKMPNEGFRLAFSRLTMENKSGYLVLCTNVQLRDQNPFMEAVDYQQIIEASPDVIMKFDLEHKHLFVNGRVEEQTGIPPKDFVGKTHEELGFPPHLVDLWDDAIEHVINTERGHRIEFPLPSGIYIDWYLLPEFDEGGKVKAVITSARDITLIKNIQRELNEKQNVLNDALSLAGLSSWEIDLVEDKVIINELYGQTLGLGAQSIEMTMAEYFEGFVLKDDQPMLMAVFQRAIETTDKNFKELYEYRVIRKDEKVIIVHGSVKVLIVQDKVVKMYGTIQDITHLRKTEEELEEYRYNLESLVKIRTDELQQSQEKLSDAIKLAQLGAWEYNLKDRTYWLSDEVVAMLGMEKYIDANNIAQRQQFEKFVHPDDTDRFLETRNTTKSTKDDTFFSNFEYRLVKAGGEIGHFIMSNKVKFDPLGYQTKHFGTLQDITHIKAAQAEKERLTTIIENTTDIVGLADENGIITYFNKTGKDFTGVDPETEQVHISKFYSEGALAAIREKGLKMAREKGVWMGENRLIDKNGKEFPVSQVIIAHKTEDGAIQSYSTVIRDMSEQKKIENDLTYKNHELDTFVYRASHDLRGPLASMIGLHQVASVEVKDSLARKYIEMFGDQVNRLNNTITTLIELTKIKELETTKVAINFNEIIYDCLNSFRNLPNFEQISFKLDIKVGTEFQSDPGLITTIVQNLLENAIKYIRQNADSYVNVLVEYDKTKTNLILEVSDNGIGVDKEIQDKIFNMFFRGNDQAMGSGLGLYILKNAVDKLGGTIDLKSKISHGSTFKITIPNA